MWGARRHPKEPGSPLLGETGRHWGLKQRDDSPALAAELRVGWTRQKLGGTELLQRFRDERAACSRVVAVGGRPLKSGCILKTEEPGLPDGTAV